MAHLEHAGWLPEHVCSALGRARGVESASIRASFRRHLTSRATGFYRDLSIPGTLQHHLRAAADYRLFYAEHLGPGRRPV